MRFLTLLVLLCACVAPVRAQEPTPWRRLPNDPLYAGLMAGAVSGVAKDIQTTKRGLATGHFTEKNPIFGYADGKKVRYGLYAATCGGFLYGATEVYRRNKPLGALMIGGFAASRWWAAKRNDRKVDAWENRQQVLIAVPITKF
jgi:hypothetical protein